MGNKNCEIFELEISVLNPGKRAVFCVLLSCTLAVFNFLNSSLVALIRDCWRHAGIMPASCRRHCTNPSSEAVLEELTAIQNRASLEFASRLKAFWPVLGPSLYTWTLPISRNGVSTRSNASGKVCFIPGRQHRRSGDRRAQSEGR